MKKRFIAKKRKHFYFFKLVLFLSIIIFTFVITFNLLFKGLLEENFDTLINYGLNEYSDYSLDLINPESMFKLSLNYLLEGNAGESFTNLNTPNQSSTPLVYIYNTHQTEEYDSSLLEAYNISYTTLAASYILSEYLNSYGVPCYVETESIKDYLTKNNLAYKYSYDASRYYINKRLEEYPSIKLIIDLHRDSAQMSTTTTYIDDKAYAKVLFVVGLDYDEYERNLEVAEQINSLINLDIKRGISKKSGANVNGIYNQDLGIDAILIEVGGVDNTITEVSNTLLVLSEAIFRYMEDNYGTY